MSTNLYCDYLLKSDLMSIVIHLLLKYQLRLQLKYLLPLNSINQIYKAFQQALMGYFLYDQASLFIL